MTLKKQIKCPTCAEIISAEAMACPRCGHTFKVAGAFNASDPVHIIGIFVCGIIVFLVVIGIVWAVVTSL